MKAITYQHYGSPDVLQLTDVPVPVPKPDEVLVKIHAASVNAYDWHMLRGKPFPARLMAGLLAPKNTILGADFAGVVESVGTDVTSLKVGDHVMGCKQGSFAEYISAPLSRLTLKPANVSFELAAATPMAGLTALQAIRDFGKVRAEQNVLINGAGGGVGTFAVQIAKSFGAEVTAVCSARNAAMVRSIGADHVIDYASQDFTKGEVKYDVILGVNGSRSLSEYKRALAPGGIYVMSGGSNFQIFQSFLGPLYSTGGKSLVGMMENVNPSDLTFLGELLQSRKIAPVIDRKYPLAEVPDAIRYLEEGHARGKVVINI